MDDPPSDGNEHVADIVLVSTDETATVLLKESLEKNSHRVTILTEDTSLKETLTAGKPKLLIYDNNAGGQEGYEVIRRIKADENLGTIPTLVLTTASTMEDLLTVLESDADNFIAPPYNLPDNLSLIEGMLATPVELRTGNEIKKQFKVRHDDHTYVVAATSRQLLEWLLSSFDILTRISSELSFVESKLRDVSESANNLEKTVTGKTRDIAILNATILQKDQEITALTRESENLNKTLSQKTDEIQTLKGESDNDQARLVGMENALNEEKVHNASLETTLKNLMFELEQQKSALVAEKNRSDSTEQEINIIKQAKTQSENDLNQIIDGLNNTTKQCDNEAARLKREMEAETNRRVLAENQAISIQREFEQSLATSLSATETLRTQVGELKETLAVSGAALETERELRRISEEKTNTLVQQQKDLENRIDTAKKEMEQVKKDRTTIVDQLNEELATSGHRVQSLEAEIGTLPGEKSRAEGEVRRLTTELEHTKNLLVNERERISAIEGAHTDAIQDRHLVQQPLLQPDVETISKENLNLIVAEEPHFPVPVNHELQEDSSAVAMQRGQFGSGSDPEKKIDTWEKPENSGPDLNLERISDKTPEEPKGTGPAGDVSFNSNQWLDLIKWAHHSEALPEDQRVKIIRMGRLIQKDRKLTKSQQDQVREILSLVRTLGYQAR